MPRNGDNRKRTGLWGTKPAVGWSDIDIKTALEHGYSIAGINNLRPSSESCNVARLLQIRNQLPPYVLDPSLKAYEDLYAAGMAEAMGFLPNAELKAKREIVIQKTKAQATKVDKVPQKSSRVEKKRGPIEEKAVVQPNGRQAYIRE